MRFILCARDRVTGDVELLSGTSFATRREAVEAITAVGDFITLAGMDVFLVDLDVAVPVAIVPWHAGSSTVSVATPPPGAGDDSVTEPAASPGSAADDGDVTDDLEDDDEISSPDDAHTPMVFDMGARLGMVHIDIEEWTCEDCIYVSTCAYSGTRRPVDCAAFQWRA